MRFANFRAIHLLWYVFALTLFLIWDSWHRKRLLEKFGEKGFWVNILCGFDYRKALIKRWLPILAMFFLVLAIMQPQWGFKWQKIKRQGLDIIVAVDVSKSMLAQDIKPSRLERTKLALADFVKYLQGDRIGLVAFAGRAFLQCPLTLDYSGFLLSVEALDVNTIPRGGTSISSAILEALKSYEGGLRKYKVLVIITDGEEHEGDSLKAAQQAKQEGVKIFCIGIGTSDGELIPIIDEKGAKSFLKDDEGRVVKSRLNEGVLQKIALTTGGSYVRASSREFGLNLIYREKLANMEKRELETKVAKQYEERFQWPLFLAFLILALDLLISERTIS